MIASLFLLQLALVVGYLAARALDLAQLPAAHRARAGRLLLFAALLAPGLVALVPDVAPWRPPAQVYDAAAGGIVVELAPTSSVAATVELPAAPVGVDRLLLGVVGLFGLSRLLLAAAAMRRGLARASPWRRVGAVRIFAHPDRGVAFAARTPWRPVVCDAAVAADPRVSPRAYGRVLLAAATTRPPSLAGAVGLSPRSPLHQRLLMLAHPPAARPLRASVLVDDAVADGVHVPDHPVIHGYLTRMVAASPGFYHRALQRRPQWSGLVDGALADAGLPPFLAVVPLVESGYSKRGAPDSPEPTSQAPGTIPGRGLWMFIPATARECGLQVDDQVDQRFDPQLETAAAVALLRDLHDRYGDWGLALAGYSMGPRAVDRAIEDGGTRDPWELTQRGLINEYAATVMAGALLLQGPSLIEQAATRTDLPRSRHTSRTRGDREPGDQARSPAPGGPAGCPGCGSRARTRPAARPAATRPWPRRRRAGSGGAGRSGSPR